MPRRSKHNPLKDGISSDTIVIFGVGTALIGALIYAVYTLSDKLDASTSAISQAGAAGQGVSDQIGQASQSAQDVAAQIAAANQTVQTAQQSPAVQAANQAANWWNQ